MHDTILEIDSPAVRFKRFHSSFFADCCKRFNAAVESHVMPAQIVLDALLCSVCVIAAFVIREEGMPAGHAARLLLHWLPVLVVARLLMNWNLGIYTVMWRFFSLTDAVRVASSTGMVTLALVGLRIAFPETAVGGRWLSLPFSTIALEFLLTLTGLIGARTMRRMIHERDLTTRLLPGKKRKRILLYGAARSGVLLAQQLSDISDIEIVGFIDDDATKAGTVVSGIKVLGTGDALATIVRNTRADQVVISMMSCRPTTLAGIVAKCRRIPVPAKIIPTMHELLNKESRITDCRDISIDDLLGREAAVVSLSDVDIFNVYRGNNILVTGAGGSIGSELTRQLLLMEPKRITILDKDENSIYELEQEIKCRAPNIPVEAVIADIKRLERILSVFAETQPQIVFHAAAHKHVPLMELQPCEAVVNNVMGTENVLKACRQLGVARVIFISTDKAVNPTSIMGATKRVGESIVRHYTSGGGIQTACVRFGNVMGSRGSVVPLFLRQIENGGPVTVTHPEILRYFMTIPEAVHLVLCAGSLANNAEVFVLDMGTPRKVIDLARQLITLCGLEPEKDIQLTFTGLRPGEKMNEELVAGNEHIVPTRFAKISAIECPVMHDSCNYDAITRLIKAARRNDLQGVYSLLAAMDFGYQPPAPFINCKSASEGQTGSCQLLYNNKAACASRASA